MPPDMYKLPTPGDNIEKIVESKNSNNDVKELLKIKDGNTDKDDNEVDAISGATITGDGVSDMIKERLENYLQFFNNIANE